VADGSRHLAVVRHAKSRAATPGQDDHERALAPRGLDDALALGRWLAGQLGGVDLVLCSSALRAVQTWERAAEALAHRPDVEVLDELYQGDPGTVLRAVRRVADGVRRLVVVGHEPTQSALALALADDGSDPDAVPELQEGFPTSAVALLEVDVTWSALRPQDARLVAFAVPRG
jgi:phosphohistidine phosphatase